MYTAIFSNINGTLSDILVSKQYIAQSTLIFKFVNLLCI